MRTSANNFRVILSELREDIQANIEELLDNMKDWDLDEEDLEAFIIVDDLVLSHFDTMVLTRVDSNGVLYSQWEDEEEVEHPYEFMSISGLVDLLETLENYYEKYSNN